MDLSLKQILDWKAAMHREKESAGEGVYRVASPVVKWETPGVGWLKVNVDASMVSEATFFTVRVIPRG